MLAGCLVRKLVSMFEQSLGVIVSKDNDLLEKFSAAYRKLGNKTKDSAAFLETLNNLQEETDLLIELRLMSEGMSTVRLRDGSGFARLRQLLDKCVEITFCCLS